MFCWPPLGVSTGGVLRSHIWEGEGYKYPGPMSGGREVSWGGGGGGFEAGVSMSQCIMGNGHSHL